MKDEKLTVSKQFKADPDSEALLALNVGTIAITKGKKKTTVLTIEQSPRKVAS